jgi:uncharacterized membrane protein HdeD (DUF308 family)
VSAASTRAEYWPVEIARAVPALAAGLVITFSADHDAFLGLIVFGAFAVATGAILGWGALRLEERDLLVLSTLQTMVTLGCGIAALLLCTTGSGTLFLVVLGFAAVTGILEILLGLRARGRHPAARDWLTVGILTALLAIAVLLVPADYALPWEVEDKGVTVSGILTAPIIVVGVLGAYAILVGVYLAIGGLSARWAIRDERITTRPVTES